MKMNVGHLDRYSFRARIQPALLTSLPIGLAALAWFPDRLLDWESLWSLVLWLGIAAFIEEYVRDQGAKREQRLWQSWGGARTTQLLRHRGATDALVLKRRHQKLEKLVGNGFRLPTPAEEASDPDAADRAYEHAVSALRERTRDIELLAAENRGYGFRRNLWGLKPWGLVISIAALVVVVVALSTRPDLATGALYGYVSLVGIVLLLVLWVWVIRPPWVRSAAYRYARQLMAALDALRD